MIHSRRTMVVTALFAVAVFGSGLALAGAIPLGRINGEFFFEDGDEPDLGGALIEVNDTTFQVDGSVFGSGTDGDGVALRFVTELPTKANADSKQGRVRQSHFSTLIFLINSEVEERNLELEISPEKCAIDGKVDLSKGEGQVTVRCSGTNIYSEISASQEASIQAAFQGTKKVKFKVNSDGSKGSLDIRLKGSFESLSAL
jgi:hypothetical protein